MGGVKRIILPLLKYRYKKLREIHYSWLRQNTDSIVVLSESYRKTFSALNNAIAIANPIEVPEASATSVNKTRSILYVGRMDRIEKSPQLLIQAWSKICHEFPDWTLDLVGDGPDKSWLQDYAAKLNIENIHFHGFQNPHPFYERAPIFCISSTNEGFTMVLVEAMSHSCTPIAFNSFPTASVIITSGENGYLIPPFSIDKYADAIKRLIENPDLCNVLSERASRKAQQFSVENIADKWITLFESITE
jgi:glycosyltransferase involved in cell wall biosynthesis